VVVFDEVSLAFDENVVLDRVTFSVRAAHMTMLIGASVAGKSVVLKLILGLLKLDSGAIYVNGERIDILNEDMAARPHLLLFDEPTSGLDPITAKTVDAEIIELRDLEHVTSILVTHQLQDAFYIATHEARGQDGHLAIVPAALRTSEAAQFVMLKDGRVYFEGPAAEAVVDGFPLESLPVWMGAAPRRMSRG
jgi:ABC-type transporter Mla maintaining outer membrane lipid asymmetry ATPase subunit MlaF